MTVAASDIPSSSILSVLVVDLECLTCIEASASNFSQHGCRILSERVSELRDVIGVRINGLDKMLRGRITALGPREADVLFEYDDLKPQEKRREQRRTVSIPASVYSQDQTVTIHCNIVDASKSGCRLKGLGLSALPSDIMLKIRGLGLPVQGQVVWCDNGYAGVRLLWQFSTSQDLKNSRSHAAVSGSMGAGQSAASDARAVRHGDKPLRRKKVRGGAFGSRD